MTLSYNNAEKLRDAGFLDYEIEQLAGAKTLDGKDQPSINLDSPAWKAVMKSRLEWIEDKINRDWTVDEMDNILMDYYMRDPKRSPWDFLKMEYRGKTRIGYYEGLRNRKRKEAEAVLGKY